MDWDLMCLYINPGKKMGNIKEKQVIYDDIGQIKQQEAKKCKR